VDCKLTIAIRTSWHAACPCPGARHLAR
jgi:hypothetical protein